MSVGFSPDCSTRVVGASNGTLYIGRRKVKDSESTELVDFGGFRPVEEPQRRVLRPSYFRYFQRGQNEKPSEWDYLIKKPKKIKVAEHDMLLKKFMHKEALLASLNGKNPENVVAVMEELVARKKLLRCVSNLETEELGLLLRFLQRYSTMPRFSRFLMGLTKKVVEMRAEDIKASDELRGLLFYIRSGSVHSFHCIVVVGCAKFGLLFAGKWNSQAMTYDWVLEQDFANDQTENFSTNLADVF
ncbi:hypothetical protein K7X08_011055 [Anisodus acutangulus]|uniref:U3 small nucleolar RNA-associated protein 15 C-terminal domain-containing protein n=1 Tax=Anisodus acutangulus TaxID=402998 RepID=A0A9Q1M213_9SOLA|nr:hypothetical protein K7X08_011055 [Anisodus acutangulus]